MPLPDEIELLCMTVQKKAEKEAQAIIDSARKRAETLLQNARNQAKRLLEQKKHAAQREVLQQARKVIDSAELRARKRILSAREEIFKNVLDGWLKNLVSIKEDESAYLGLIKKMLKKASNSLPDGALNIKVAIGDVAFFKRHLKELEGDLNRKINLDDETVPISGGLLAYSSDRKVLLDLSFESILRSIEPNVRKMVAEKIFEEAATQ